MKVFNFFFSIILMIIGSVVRLNSRGMAWPGQFSYSGERANTQWAIFEGALNDISMGVFYVGAFLLVCTLLLSQYQDNIEV